MEELLQTEEVPRILSKSYVLGSPKLISAYYMNSEVTVLNVGLRFSCVRLTPQKMSPTQYARTVQCTDEVMCYCVWYGTVR